MNFIERLLDTSDYPARWNCGKWTAFDGWLHITSDIGVWTAYTAIPVVLVILARNRTDVPFRNVFWLFSAFILLCGTTHLMEAVIFWWPAYRLAGLLKFATAVVSWATVISLIPILPQALALHRPEELAREIAEKERALAAQSQSEERYRILLEGVREFAIIMLDENGLVSSWNTGAQRISGYSTNEILGSHFSIFYPLEDAADGRPARELEIVRTEGSFEELGWRIRKDGTRYWANVVITALRDPDGRLRGFAKVTRDLTSKRAAEEALQESEALLRLFIRHAPAAIAMLDTDLHYVMVSDRWLSDYRLPDQNLVGRSHYDVFPDLPEEWHAAHQRVLAGAVEQKAEDAFIRSDGTIDWLQWEARPWRTASGSIGGLIFFTQIVSDRKRTEDALHLSIREKEVLLREIHHRVKNNLSVVCGLFQLHIGTTSSQETIQALADAEDRVRSMALVHEHLYKSTDLAAVEFDEYVKHLSSQIVSTNRLPSVKLDLLTDAEPCRLDLDQAIPCGLILNELLINSLKHAFRQSQRGVIRITLRRKANSIILTVSDDGVGLPDGLDHQATKSLGVRLVRTLARQLRGEISYRNAEPGTEACLTFCPQQTVQQSPRAESEAKEF